MALSLVRIKQKPKQSSNVLLSVGMIVAASGALSLLLTTGWISNDARLHTLFDASTVFIALSIFMVVWHNYERNTPVNQLVGLGFLAVAIFDLLHSFFYALPYQQTFDVSHTFRLLSRLTEALILVILCSDKFKHKINKWYGLGIAFTVCFGITISVFSFPGGLADFPQSVWGLALEYITIGLFCFSIYLLRQHPGINNNSTTNRYILLALLIAIPTEISFVWFYNTNAFFTVFGHILKIAYNYCLFKGIFVAAITYPYEKLEAASEYMESVLNDLPEGIVTCNETAQVQFVNRKAYEYLGIRVKQAGITGISEFEENLVLDRFRTSLPVDNKIMTVNDGLGNLAKLRINTRQLASGGTLCMFTDVKQEQELENLQLQTQTLLNAMNNLVLMVDPQGKIILCNKALENICEMDARDILGMHLTEFNQLIQFSRKPAGNISPMPVDGHCTYEAALVTPKGNKKEIIYNDAPILNVDQQCIGRIAVGSEVTLIKKQQDKMLQQEKLIQLGQMAAGVVHEIRNPLTALKGFSQIILAKSEDEKIKEFARIMEIEASGVNKVVSDFLAFAKPSPPVLREVSLFELISAMKTLLESHSFTRETDIRFDLAVTEEKVLADEGQLKQVIMNMVNNAIDAMAETVRPRLTISTKFEPVTREMIIMVTDNGIGIEAEGRAKIGTPFYTTKDKGTGLGLSICYQILKEHNGKIEVESLPGLGSSFKIILPWASMQKRHACISA